MYLRPTATLYTYGLVLWPAGYHYAFDVAPRHIAKVEKCQTYLLCKPCGQICYLVAVFNLGCTVYFYVCTHKCVCMCVLLMCAQMCKLCTVVVVVVVVAQSAIVVIKK